MSNTAEVADGAGGVVSIEVPGRMHHVDGGFATAAELEQPTTELAFTGVDPGPLAALGVGLVLAGAALRRWAR